MSLYEDDIRDLEKSLGEAHCSRAMIVTSRALRLAGCKLAVSPEGFSCAAFSAGEQYPGPIPGYLPCTGTKKICEERHAIGVRLHRHPPHPNCES